MGGAARGVLAVLVLAVCGLNGCVAGSGQPLFGAPRSSDEDVWSILCITLRGPEAPAMADKYAAALRNVPGLKPQLVQVLIDDDGTHVYYGRYERLPADPDATPRYRPDHQPDLERIRALRLSNDNVWPFILATMNLLPTYRSAHPEWNLEDANGYWTLHVAVFYNTATMLTRRSAAEEYCQLLRQQGEEAYYHHGAVNSSVYVGTYPKDAIQVFREENPLAARVKTTQRIVDPKMIETQQRFPHSVHNGYTFYEIQRDPQSGEVSQKLPAPSFPVQMPKAERAERAESAELRPRNP